MKPWTITTIPPERWRLTPAETNVMDSMVEHGQITLVAGDLGLAYDTVQQHVWRSVALYLEVQPAVAMI